MIATIHILLLLWAVIVAVPAVVLLVECAAAHLARSSSRSTKLPPKIGILISAHNEEALITSTVASIKGQLREGDSILVVADNCDDATAQLARATGATVTERNDLSKRGKGYGLSHGLDELRKNPPDVLIIFDADCEVAPGIVAKLAAQAWELDRPIQATYLLASPASAGPRGTVSTLAFIVKNAVRPTGLAAFGLPCALTGTGMAFPWELIEHAPLASGHIVEDMELGLHFLRAGKGPRLCTTAIIQGHMPSDAHAQYVQRTRWEHGHLSMICGQALPLVMRGLFAARFDLIAAGLDLMVPPLALLAGMWCMGITIALAAAKIWGFWAPATVCATSGLFLAAAIFMAWLGHARHLPLGALLAVPAYVFWKIPMYLRFAVRRERNWVRTSRAPLPPVGEGATTG